jgi:hypothetical protein
VLGLGWNRENQEGHGRGGGYGRMERKSVMNISKHTHAHTRTHTHACMHARHARTHARTRAHTHGHDATHM